jgi:hypothetical protein
LNIFASTRGFWVQGSKVLGSRFIGSGFRVQKIQGSRFRVLGSEVQGSGFKIL